MWSILGISCVCYATPGISGPSWAHGAFSSQNGPFAHENHKTGHLLCMICEKGVTPFLTSYTLSPNTSNNRVCHPQGTTFAVGVPIHALMTRSLHAVSLWNLCVLVELAVQALLLHIGWSYPLLVGVDMVPRLLLGGLLPRFLALTDVVCTSSSPYCWYAHVSSHL